MSRLARTYGLIRSLWMYYGMFWRFQQIRQFYAQFIEPGGLCFDVGAHVGSRSRLWAAMGAQVVAIEPQPHLMRFLKRMYGKRDDIILVEAGLGAKPGKLTLRVSEKTPTVTTFSDTWLDDVQQVDSFAWVEWDQSVVVPVTTMDALITEYGLPTFCKIDVEGFEFEVLRGLSQPIKALSIEFIPASLRSTFDCLNYLGQLGDYRYNIAISEGYQFVFEEWQPVGNVHDWLTTLDMTADSGDVYARLVNSLSIDP